MGASDSSDARSTTVTVSPFIVSQLLTIGQMKRLIEATGPFFSIPNHPFNRLSPGHPVVALSWFQQKEIAGVLGMCLLTEVQWKFMAAGGRYDDSYGGVDPDEIVCWETLKKKRLSLGPKAVRSGPRNAYGIYHSVGNLWVPVEDWYDPQAYEKIRGQTDPCVREQHPRFHFKVFLGGTCWNYLSSARVANRHYDNPDGSYSVVGCRLALPPALP
jgi:formylglycine-generating enzyme required for sulfatase activity